jgi:hypothetical protein
MNPYSAGVYGTDGLGATPELIRHLEWHGVAMPSPRLKSADENWLSGPASLLQPQPYPKGRSGRIPCMLDHRVSPECRMLEIP